jgi:hypothetical protein
MEPGNGGFRGLLMVLMLNSDRILYVATVALALAVGAFLGSLFLP